MIWVAIDPTSELATRVHASKICTWHIEGVITTSADGINYSIVMLTEFFMGDVLTDGDGAEETNPIIVEDKAEQFLDNLFLFRMIGRHPIANEPPWARKTIEKIYGNIQVDRFQKMLSRIETGWTSAHYSHPSGYVAFHRATS